MTIHWMSLDGGLQQTQFARGGNPLELTGGLLSTASKAVGSIVSGAANALNQFAENTITTHPILNKRAARMREFTRPLANQSPNLLVNRLLYETQGGYARSVGKMKGIEDAGMSSDIRAIIDRETIREFCVNHPDLQEKLTPILQAVEASCNVELVKESRNELTRLCRTRPSLEAFIRNAYDKALCRRINIYLQTLSPGESVSMCAGTDMHAVSLEIKRNEDNTYTCLLYNTGLGSKIHRHMGNMIYPLTWTNIPLSRLDNNFFQQVLSAEAPKRTASFVPERDMEVLVDMLYSLLGKDDWEAAGCERAYQNQGQLGSCVTKSRSVWLHSAMNALDPSGELYRRFKYETTDKLIKRFDEAFPEVMNGTPDTDPRMKPQGSQLTLGQLREIRKRAGEILKRRSELRKIAEPEVTKPQGTQKPAMQDLIARAKAAFGFTQ